MKLGWGWLFIVLVLDQGLDPTLGAFNGLVSAGVAGNRNRMYVGLNADGRLTFGKSLAEIRLKVLKGFGS